MEDLEGLKQRRAALEAQIEALDKQLAAVRADQTAELCREIEALDAQIGSHLGSIAEHLRTADERLLKGPLASLVSRLTFAGSLHGCKSSPRGGEDWFGTLFQLSGDDRLYLVKIISVENSAPDPEVGPVERMEEPDETMWAGYQFIDGESTYLYGDMCDDPVLDELAQEIISANEPFTDNERGRSIAERVLRYPSHVAVALLMGVSF